MWCDVRWSIGVNGMIDISNGIIKELGKCFSGRVLEKLAHLQKQSDDW